MTLWHVLPWGLCGQQSLILAPEKGTQRHSRLVGMHVMGWTSDLTSRHGARQGGGEEGHVTRKVLQTGMRVWGIEIPTIIIFQIQRLLVSEQRNNKFNQRWSLKEKERGWVLREHPSTKKEVSTSSLPVPWVGTPAGSSWGSFWILLDWSDVCGDPH